ncbi:DNA-binding transcriptional LysR family regulator [Paenibacillus anaericanus]|uniref:LysR family transcriptional regulator n=1 Tax=Paenibacillus anaericanus TaxID=170367 RepID=UPI00278A3A9E|nr:LysR family transcriptional regulator [Paenibacillus anaericanus]MDQ0087079.1 DNA-binding transcriptional LysR family regulator [Paenibacillus anaericanus]
MNMETLKLFLDIAMLKSISKAAQKSHITQSALSQQLKSWESNLGTELLVRSNKGANLTEAGIIAERYAGQICKLYDDMITEINHLQPSQHELSIYAIPEVCNYALPCTLYEVKKHFPNCHITLNEGPSYLVEERLVLEEGDVGFISGPSSKSDLISNMVFSDQVMLVASSSTICPDRISLDELSEYPLIWSSQLNCVQRALNSSTTGDLKLNILFNLDSIEAVKLAAIRGHGVAFLPYMSIKKELYSKQLKIIHIDHFQVNNDVYMVKKQNQRCDNDTKQLIRYIEKTLIDTLC